MATLAAPPQATFPTTWSMADLQDHLGGIPLDRIRLYPQPGTATEEDVIRAAEGEKRLCELIDGVLVEKTTGMYESMLALVIGHVLLDFLDKHPGGMALGADGALKILSSQVRVPDVCFISSERLAALPQPLRPIPALVPDLAVEVLSKSNTKAEMERKLHDYFEAGVELVWSIDPWTHTAKVYTSPEQVTEVDEDGLLDGGEVLPGFQISLTDLFERAERQAGGVRPE